MNHANEADELIHLMGTAVEMARQWAEDGHGPSFPQVKPGQVAARLEADPPARGRPLPEVLEEYRQRLLPAMVPWNHPRFFAYFGASAPPPAVLGATAATLLNTNVMMFRTSPAGTELSEVVASWLRRALGLPEVFEGVFLESASSSVLHAMVAAIARATGGQASATGLDGSRRPKIFVTSETHFSVKKAALVTGIGQHNVIEVACDPGFAMDPAALERALCEARNEGALPVMVVATIGTTSTTAVDPVTQIAEVCRRHGVWLHVDAAYGGMLALVPECRWVLAGAEQADSITINPHKQGFVPLGCSVLYMRQRQALAAIFCKRGAYTTSAPDEVTNLMDFTFGTGQPLRAAPLWFVMKAWGIDGLVARLRQLMALARHFEEWIRRSPHFELLAPVRFTTICFRAHPPGIDDEDHLRALNGDLLQAFLAEGHHLISSTEVKGRLALRISIGNHATREADVASAFRHLQACLAGLSPTVPSPWPDQGSWSVVTE